MVTCACACADERLGTGQQGGPQSGSRRQRAYSVGLGRRRSSRDSEDIEEPWNSTGTLGHSAVVTCPVLRPRKGTLSSRGDDAGEFRLA